MLALLFILTGSAIIPGLILLTRSLLSGRRGPGFLQPFYNIWLLLRKGSVFSTTSGFVQQIAPVLVFSSVAIASLFVPLVNSPGLFSFPLDFILFIALLALARFWMILAAMDAGSSFEAMGASREALYGMLAEPALFIMMAGLALLHQHNTFVALFNSPQGQSMGFYAATFLSVLVMFLLMLLETGRMPFDDPKTHLELTMIHEVMILDLSGFDLALIQMGSLLKFGIFSSLLASLIIPSSLNMALKIPGVLLIQALCGIAIGFLESFLARNRMNKNAQTILSISAFALIVFIIALLIRP